MNSSSTPLRFALLFSVVILLLLSFPLYIYWSFLYHIEESRLEIELSRVAEQILIDMERYDPSLETSYYFPRFVTYEAALMSESGHPIFSTLTKRPPSLTQTFSASDEWRFYSLKLPPERYFGASYLVVAKKFNTTTLLIKILTIIILLLGIVFAISLTMIRLFEKPLIRARESLDRFIRDAMHEMNTPLSVIRTNIELLQMKGVSNHHLERINAAAKTLAGIYDDMDYLIKSTRTDMIKEKVNMTLLVAQCIAYFEEIASLKGIKLEATIDQEAYLYINPTKLLRILDNNISNAIKYSHENSVIRITLSKEAEGLLWSIEDEGIGIEDTTRIFERYYREDLAKGGFGLGLAIVKKICDEEGITISVDSTPGVGSTFRYFFPAKA